MPTHNLSIADIVCKLSRRELRRLLLAESERNRHVLRAVTDYFETTRGISTDLDFKHHVSFVYHYFKPLRTSSYYMKEKPMISKPAMKPAPPDKIKPVLQTICQEVTDIASLGTKRNAIVALRTIGKLCFDDYHLDYKLNTVIHALKAFTAKLSGDELKELVDGRYGSLKALGDFMSAHPDETALVQELDEEWEKADEEAREEARQDASEEESIPARKEESEEARELTRERAIEDARKQKESREARRQDLMKLMEGHRWYDGLTGFETSPGEEGDVSDGESDEDWDAKHAHTKIGRATVRRIYLGNDQRRSRGQRGSMKGGRS
jgi:hypothetical protein